jgi:anaerobic selenocysteine-containing dehydrogenase
MGVELGERKKETVTSICGICPGGCGVNVELIDGKIEKIFPIKGHPVGVVCVRGVHSKEIVYSSDRLRYPLLRVGERGEGKFERITWDEAMDRIVDKFQMIKREYGAEAVMTYFGRGSFDTSLIDAFAPRGLYTFATLGILFPFGSPNVAGVCSVCYVSYGLFAGLSTIGTDMRFTYPDFANTNLVVIWGANPPTDSPPNKVKKIFDAQKRGAKVVVIDPMRSDMAKKADQWIGVRSGTDGALALSMINVIVNERLYNEEFVQNWTVGFEELRQYVQKFPPEVAEGITWVPRETIVEMARAIAGSKGASLVMYTGLEYTNSGVQNIRAVLSLWAITGNIDVPGGLVFRPRNPARFSRIEPDPPEEVKPIGADKYPLFCDILKSAQFMEAPRAILNGDPYLIKALLVFGSSLLTSLPNPEIWKKCFRKLDFMVTFDRFMTGDGMYADIVLPGTTGFENLGYEKYPGGYCQLRQRVIEPLEEARPGFVFLTDLAKRLGYAEIFPATEEEHVNFVFEGSPVSIEDLKARPEGVRYDAGQLEYHKYAKGLIRSERKPGFTTPSGKIELVSSLLQEYGYDGLPVYLEPIEGPLASPELYKKYGLVLNTGARLQSAFRSQHLNIPGLLKLQPKPQVLINPVDAKARGIVDGDKVWVESLRGRVGVWAKVTDDVTTGQVELNVGGGSPIHAEEWRDANANYVTDFENRDPISGFPVYKALLCEIKKRD